MMAYFCIEATENKQRLLVMMEIHQKNMNSSTYLISDVLTDYTLSRAGFCFPAEQRRNADDGRQDPDSSDHGSHASRRSFDGVLEWALDDEIPVDTDSAQVQYRRRT